jgi:hypothetical protein
MERHANARGKTWFAPNNGPRLRRPRRLNADEGRETGRGSFYGNDTYVHGSFKDNPPASELPLDLINNRINVFRRFPQFIPADIPNYFESLLSERNRQIHEYHVAHPEFDLNE